jgi:hypothetical protein
MPKFWCIPVLAMCFTTMAIAQTKETNDLPKVEVFGGYSYLHTYNSLRSFNDANGWEASASFNFNRWLAVTGDIDGHYVHASYVGGSFPLAGFTFTVPPSSRSLTTYNFLAGPEVAWRHAHGKVFAHALIGGAHQSSEFKQPDFSIGGSSSGASFAIGGGGDWMFGRRFGWRLAQGDYILNRFNGFNFHYLRLSSGVVFHFGSK